MVITTCAVRSVAVVLIAIIAGTACSSSSEVAVRVAPDDATTTTAGTSLVPADGTLAVWTMSGGECGEECAFTGTFRSDGTLLWSSGRGGAVVEFDPSDAIAVNGSLSEDVLVTGTDDCMREVDGNAPSLLVRDRAGDPLEIDTCYDRLDPDHPMTLLTGQPVDRARAAASPLLARISAPEEPCDPRTTEVCPVIVHDVFADGLVITSTPSSIAEARSVPASAHVVEGGLVDRLRAITVAGVDRDGLCRPDDDGADAVSPTYSFAADLEFPQLVGTAGCVADRGHPAIVLAEQIIGR